MIVDSHMHMLQQFGYRQGMRTADMVNTMHEMGIDKAVLFTTEGFYSNYKESNDRIIVAYREFPEHIIPFCTVDPRDEGAMDEMNRCRDIGFRGIKFHPWLQAIAAVDDKVLKVSEKAASFGWPIISHDGTPPYCTSFQVAYISECIPEANVILGHSGMKDFAREALEAARRNPNVYLGFCGATFQIMKTAVETIGADRCIFGSDYPFASIDSLKYFLELIQQLQLSKEDEACVVVDRGVHHDVDELQKLILGPEKHFLGFLFAHASCLCSGVDLQTIELDCMVKDGAHLVVDGFQIGFGKGLTFGIG